jgi:hypothetical protein
MYRLLVPGDSSSQIPVFLLLLHGCGDAVTVGKGKGKSSGEVGRFRLLAACLLMLVSMHTMNTNGLRRAVIALWILPKK